MTQEQLQDEWDYRYHERLGHLCEDREPTPIQKWRASREAHATIRAITSTPPEHGSHKKGGAVLQTKAGMDQ